MRDSWGMSGTGETPKSDATRWLTARPPESEHPVTEINYFQEQQRLCKKEYEKTAPV
ncbi:hypothetical protein [Fictibacillus phosphorivorans]|uniref:hypothetical protein n=1 Tax=Fictibacillus phosphorivorans TaxID=1221500 RepID=UPI0021B4B163|nr:hypothetical protein [Fictibacillus phosphorivorans]